MLFLQPHEIMPLGCGEEPFAQQPTKDLTNSYWPLGVCRTMSLEASSILYSRKVFRLVPQEVEDIEIWFTSIGLCNVQRLRYLCVDSDHALRAWDKYRLDCWKGSTREGSPKPHSHGGKCWHSGLCEIHAIELGSCIQQGRGRRAKVDDEIPKSITGMQNPMRVEVGVPMKYGVDWEDLHPGVGVQPPTADTRIAIYMASSKLHISREMRIGY